MQIGHTFSILLACSLMSCTCSFKKDSVRFESENSQTPSLHEKLFRCPDTSNHIQLAERTLDGGTIASPMNFFFCEQFLESHSTVTRRKECSNGDLVPIEIKYFGLEPWILSVNDAGVMIVDAEPCWELRFRGHEHRFGNHAHEYLERKLVEMSAVTSTPGVNDSKEVGNFDSSEEFDRKYPDPMRGVYNPRSVVIDRSLPIVDSGTKISDGGTE
jgi:hypothetical protein